MIWLFSAYPTPAQVSVLAQHNDNARTGLNPNETILSTSTVNLSNFGKLFWRTVDGYIYAQPLYVPGLSVGGATRNVVFVATEHNSVYAFDADEPNQPTPLWRVNLGTPVPSDDVCVPLGVCPYDDLQPEIGITSTPVIDTVANAMYVVAHTKNTNNSTYHFWLHKLSLTTGADMMPAVEITTSGFTPLFQLNRPGLLLLNNVIYIAFGSAGDFGDWHGWVISYDLSTLKQYVYSTTPGNVQNFVPGESGGGGIFSCGQGLVADTNGSLYFFTGNGPFDANTGGQDYGDSAIKLRASDLAFMDYFTPSDAVTLGLNNIDLGAGGPLLIPNTGLLVGGGKDGMLRVLNTSNMGQFNTSDQVVQEWTVTGAWIMGSPVYWNGQIYLWPSGDVLKAWKFNGSTFQTMAQTGSITSPSGESNTSPISISANLQQAGTGILWTPTSPISISANVRQAGTGILWAPTSSVGDPNKNIQPGILHAFDASNLDNELWNSEQDSERDSLGYFAKFNPPTVANGKVYLGTFSGQLVVYGLNPPPPSGIAYVQGTSNALTSGSSSEISAGYTSTQQAGDLNIVAVSWGDTTSEVQSVTDSNGNTYTRAVRRESSSSVSQTIYYAKNIKGGSNTVIVNFNQAAFLPGIRILEYSGVDTSNPLDVTASASGTSSSSAGAMADSGPAATNFYNELIFGAGTDSKLVLKPGNPFVPRVVTANSDLAEDHMVNVPNTYDATNTVTPGSNWVMQMATFKASVQPAGSFSLRLSPTAQNIVPGSSTSFVVTVSAANGFSGSVSLSCSGLPAHTACNPATVNAGSSSTLTVTSDGSLAPGTYTFTVVGTFGSQPPQQATASLTAELAGFALAISPASASVSAGQSASYTVTVSSQNGFSNPVSLTCSGAPTGAQCSLDPASVIPGGTSTLTMTTSGSSARLRTAPWNGTPFYALWLFLPGMAVAGLRWKVSTRRRAALIIVLAVGLVTLLALQLSCGGGGSSTPPPPTGGTPPGTYTIMVTGTSGTVQLSTPVTLTVQ